MINRCVVVRLANKALDQIQDFNAQGIANTVWAFATLGLSDETLLKALAQEAISQIHSFNPQEIANIVWAFATLGIKEEGLLKVLAQEAITKIQSFNPQDIASTGWSFATLGIKNEALLNALAQEAISKIQNFNPQNIANTAFAFATLDIKNKTLLNALAQEAIAKIRSFNPQDIANTAWAFATLGEKNLQLLSQLAKQARNQIEDFLPVQIASLSWSFALLDYFDNDYFETVNSLINKNVNKFTDNTVLKQLCHVNLYLQFELGFPFANCLKNKIDQAFDSLKSPKPPSSRLHNEISRHISKKFPKVRFENEFFVEGFFIDIAFPHLKMGIEVLGLHTFTMANGTRERNSSSKFSKAWAGLCAASPTRIGITRVRRKGTIV
jgi:hypothetical protein